MSDDQTTPEAEATPEDKGPEPKTYGEDYVKELRQQAAKYRTEKNSAVEEAKAAIKAEFEAAIAAKDAELADAGVTLTSRELELAKLKIAMQTVDSTTASRAEKLADLLKGEDEDSISASAQSAYELFGGFKTTVPATDPSQGRGSEHLPLNGDPILQALKARVGF